MEAVHRKVYFRNYFSETFTFQPWETLPVHWLGGIILKPEYEGHILLAVAVSGHLTGQHSSHPLQPEHGGDGN